MTHAYTSAKLFDDLDGIPSDDEVRRLVEYYPTYEKDHRLGLLQGILDGKTHSELVLGKMKSKGIEYPTAQQKGGHGHWVVSKVRKTAIRLLYLRFTLDQGMTRIEAHKELFNMFPLEKDSIRYATRQPK